MKKQKAIEKIKCLNLAKDHVSKAEAFITFSLGETEKESGCVAYGHQMVLAELIAAVIIDQPEIAEIIQEALFLFEQDKINQN